MFKEIYKHLSRKRKKQLVLLLFLSIMASISELISVWVVLPFLNAMTYPDKYLSSNLIVQIRPAVNITSTKDLILFITLIFCLITILSGSIRLFLIWFQNKLSQKIGADLSSNIFKNTLYQPYLSQISKNSSELISGVVNKSNAIVNSAIMPFFVIFSSVLIFLMILILLLLINPLITFFLIFGFFVLYFIIIQISKKKIVNFGNIINQKQPSVIKVLQEGLGGIRDILIDGSQNIYCEIYRNADSQVRNAQANLILIGQAPRYILESLGMVLIAVVAYSISKNSNGTANVTIILGGFAMGALRLLPVLQQFYGSWTSYKSGKQACYDAIELLNYSLPEYIDDKNILPLKFNESINLINIKFKYSNDLPFIFSDFNLKINKGDCIGIIGSTGCGKSTLLDIIMTLISPNEGNIMIDDTRLTPNNIRSWQSQIAHVPQSIFLSDTSIAENIAFGVPANLIDMNRVVDAAERAKISNLIENMAHGYNTLVGERGIRLSGGQKQRIGIARALYKRTNVLVLDEATSALDNTTEFEIMKSINDLDNNITIFIVAHRLTTLKMCNKIIELENGYIKNNLTYNQLNINN
jgi:ABC-type bacteriocin/lantibiotic exporter with double-glycine peptidase domain